MAADQSHTLWARRAPAAPTPAPMERSDRIARGVILGGGLFVLLLLAWGHLGLGALLLPPAASAQQQTAWAGPYEVRLVMASGQLTARGPNTIVIEVRDAHGQPDAGAHVYVAAGMTSMVMEAPTSEGVSQGSGRYLAHPIFGMAGPWQLAVTIAAPGQPARQAPFDVGVRWS